MWGGLWLVEVLDNRSRREEKVMLLYRGGYVKHPRRRHWFVDGKLACGRTIKPSGFTPYSTDPMEVTCKECRKHLPSGPVEGET